MGCPTLNRASQKFERSRMRTKLKLLRTFFTDNKKWSFVDLFSSSFKLLLTLKLPFWFTMLIFENKNLKFRKHGNVGISEIMFIRHFGFNLQKINQLNGLSLTLIKFSLQDKPPFRLTKQINKKLPTMHLPTSCPYWITESNLIGSI